MAVQPGGRLLGLDVDPIEIVKTEARLRALEVPSESIVVKHGNYAGIAAFLAVEAPEGVDVLLADLGLSSMQIDDPSRGFTFKTDGPLDMRMNPSRGRPASELLSSLNDDALATILAENADERLADDLAAAILQAHAQSPLTTTQALVDVVNVLGKRLRIRPDETTNMVRRVFQALRIAVNDEFRALESLLRSLPRILKPGGRAAILTFHSGEDRRVKAAFKDGLHQGIYAFTNDEVIRPSPAEQRDNPRSSSAKLRYAVRSSN